MPRESPSNPSAEMFHRHAGNPILTARDWPYPAHTVFNAGACQAGEETILLVRVEDRRGHSHLTVARSSDGVSKWRIDAKPSFPSDPANYPEEEWGVEDARLTWIPDRGQWIVAYTAYSSSGPLVSLAGTKDFVAFSRLGPVMPPEDKDAALFPRRFGNRYAMIHRPVSSTGSSGAHLWLSFSPDLTHWGDHQVPACAARGVVGRQQDRPGPPSAGNARGLADSLPRRTRDRRRVPVSAGTGAVGFGGSVPGPASQRRMGFCAGDALRATGRCGRRRVSLRLDSGRARQHDSSLLWRGRHLPCPGYRAALRGAGLPSHVPGPQEPEGRGNNAAG